MSITKTPYVRLATLACAVSLSTATLAETVTIGTVNNGDMIRMQALSSEFEAAHPDIDLEWVILEENVLRQRLTTDIAANSGQFDVMTIGMYEAPIWGANDWLVPMDNLPASYDVNDIFPSVRGGLSANGTLYALPFYGESSMTYYRTDLFEQAGLTMPSEPTWEQVREFAVALHDPANEQYGICLRGKAGWGENMALFTTMVNAFGGRWFDMDWNAQLESEQWHNALEFYVDLLGNYGPPGASSNGFNENLALFNTGKCAMWVDATVAGSFVTDDSQSQVPDQVGFAAAPKQVTHKGSGWLWAWALAIPVSSDAKDAAQEFVTWATSKEYSRIVAEEHGIAAIPPGTRKSTYENDAYLEAASFADMTLSQMQKADPNDSTLEPSPYTGVQFVAIPGFSGFATVVGQQVAGALSGNTSVDQALSNANRVVDREIRRAGYQD
ncbi:ABC transporter substrate-binding protein [Saccharospirillum salsuginis]|uniref:Sugar ABC transporter substrate-binding protein n=1 Tax=Saccharospirillum salsuginis TaxID=418750 RepID=A0A918KKI1_9GAMM|nr:sugar ABC transporter substrate-binding protein [Saccharospirillum salsuginis]GGX67478.1 sugar ABC transporter substrate-binding protein [Saccharospirillum salsuginis]